MASASRVPTSRLAAAMLSGWCRCSPSCSTAAGPAHPRRRRPGQLHRNPRRHRRGARPRHRLGLRDFRHVVARADCGRARKAKSPSRLRAATANCSSSNLMGSSSHAPISTTRPLKVRLQLIHADVVIGSGAAALVEARGSGEARERVAGRGRCHASARSAAQPFRPSRSTPVRPTPAPRSRPDGDCRHDAWASPRRTRAIRMTSMG